MAIKVGQILYGVRGAFPAPGEPTYYESSNNYKTIEQVNIYDVDGTDIIKRYGYGIITKLGIQAPTGTVCYINKQKIVIGQSGVFELDENIPIDNFYFRTIYKIEENIAATEKAYNNSQYGFNRSTGTTLDTTISTKLNDITYSNGDCILNNEKIYLGLLGLDSWKQIQITKLNEKKNADMAADSGDVDEIKKIEDDYWISYNDLHIAYQNCYDYDYSQYLNYVNKIYYNTTQQEKQYDIIIDFIYDASFKEVQ